jgi:hypothetical protein
MTDDKLLHDQTNPWGFPTDVIGKVKTEKIPKVFHVARTNGIGGLELFLNNITNQKIFEIIDVIYTENNEYTVIYKSVPSHVQHKDDEQEQ